jgi:GDPmannose 4,6-dehydratase
MKSAIITGSNGQDGWYLHQLLKREGVDAVLVSRASGVDLSDFNEVVDLVLNTRPDFIFHLAARSTIDHIAARTNHNVIACGSFNLLEAVQKWRPECKVFLAGSAYQFKNEDKPISETDPWDTTSVYCAARGYSKLLADAYRAQGLMAYFGYFFHHESPRRGANHISQRIARAARNRESIEIGDPNVTKEWTFAGDTMEAVWALVNQDKIFEANIGTGIGQPIAKFAELCYATQGLYWLDHIKVPTDYVSPYRSLTCNPERIYSTGWRPRVSIEELAQQMVNL